MPRQSGKDRFARVRELYSFDERLGSGLVSCMETSEPPPLKRAGPHKKQDLTPTLAGFDEAGRGALAGPVTVGCVHFPVLTSGSIPHSVAGQHTDRSITQSFNHSILHSLAGVDDSKRLSPARREEMYRRITEVSSWGVGWASAQEIDRLGIVPAVSLAARRAYSMMGQRVNLLLCDRGISLLGRGKSGREDNAERRTRNAGKAKTRRHVDTNWDTKSHILPSPFCIPRSAFRVSPSPCPPLPKPPELSCTKGDSHSLHIAAASILAKVSRDRMMLNLHQRFPVYGFDTNKGYGTRAHLAVLHDNGPSAIHRRSFRVKE